MPAKSGLKRRSKQAVERIRADYAAVKGTADNLLDCLRVQLATLLEREGVTLGVPLEARVKSLVSVEEKLRNRSSPGKSVSDLTDIVGIRLILLFRKDLDQMDITLKDTFRIISFENTADRLGENEFGYQSNHYLIKLPESWLEIPSYAELGDLTAEIQVRTLAQHIWAAASHKLQYKREESVPPPLRRTIHRVSALLETVDLEFERALIERASYIEAVGSDPKEPTSLNVDLIAKILKDNWPTENLDVDEDFDNLLENLEKLDVNTPEELVAIIQRQKNATLAEERQRAEDAGPEDYEPEDISRMERGVYYTLVGLTRTALEKEFGRKKVWTVMGFGDLLSGEDDQSEGLR